MHQELPHKYILVGVSGTGKSTMAQYLTSELGLKRCITCTTRPPRPGEVEKGEYYFVQSFDMLSMFEQAEFSGHRYGITNDELSKGDFVILEPQGVDYYLKNYPGSLTVIKLERKGIDVDAERRARDVGAGFDKVVADLTVHGETVEEMKENLIAGILSFEARGLRETGWSPLKDLLLQKEIHGRGALYFRDSIFDLNVTSEQHHMEYAEPPFGHDGISCYDAADYDCLFAAFSKMTEKKQDCVLDLQIQNEKDEPLYFCRLNSHAGAIDGELHADYLHMEPYRFVAKTPEQALDLAFGGFIAAQTDGLGQDGLAFKGSKAVRTYREVISADKFEVREGDPCFNSLADKIRIAEAVRNYQLQKLFSENERFPVPAENER